VGRKNARGAHREFGASTGHRPVNMTNSIKARLEREWDLDEGFLGQLRTGNFDSKAYRRLLETLTDIQASSYLERDVVRLIWYIPIFMEWNKEITMNSLDSTTYGQATNSLQIEVERILGTP